MGLSPCLTPKPRATATAYVLGTSVVNLMPAAAFQGYTQLVEAFRLALAPAESCRPVVLARSYAHLEICLGLDLILDRLRTAPLGPSTPRIHGV